MGQYNITCDYSGLFYLGFNQIIANMQKRKEILDYAFAPFYKDPYSKEGWQQIKTSVGLYGISSLMQIGASPSKPPRQGDGQFTPFTMDKQVACCVDMYDKGLASGAFVDSTVMELEFIADWNPVQQMESMMRWNALCYGYEVIEELEVNTNLIMESIGPYYKKIGTIDKSPAQLYFFGGTACTGEYLGEDKLEGPEWSFFEGFAITETLFFNLDDLWYMDIPTI